MRLIKLQLVTSLAFAAALLLSHGRAHAAAAVCGDGVCKGSQEECVSSGGAKTLCPEDCCTCGNGTCDAVNVWGIAEDCTNCNVDCYSTCPAGGCGDLFCDDGEDCSTCSSDCGACPGYVEMVDFATCPSVLPTCDESTTSCCKRPFTTSDGRLPIIIPMDRCHQPMTAPLSGNKYSPPTQAAAWCANPGIEDSANPGMLYAYGLVYRLMQAGIPVYWVINPTKDPQALDENQSNLTNQTYTDRDIDMWILSPDDTDGQAPKLGDSLTSLAIGETPPVKRLNADLSVAEDYSKSEFPIRGSAWVIAANDRARFDEFFTNTGEFAAHAGNSYYDFSTVDLYEVQDGARMIYPSYRSTAGPYPMTVGAPVAVTLDSEPPRLAVQEGGPARTWLTRVNLNQVADVGCETGLDFTPADAVYCDVTNAEIDSNALIDAEFDWAWLHGPGLSCTAMQDLDDFMTAIPDVKDGHHVMFMETTLTDSEACSSGRFLGISTAGVSSVATAGAAPYILRYPSNIIAQIGDVPAGFAQGSPSKWTYDDGAAGNLYRAAHYAWGAGGTLMRLVSEDRSADCSSPLNKSTSTCDVFSPGSDDVDFIAYIRHNDVAENGVAFYAAGNNINPQSTTAHLRMVMNAFLSLPTATVDVTPPEIYVEVSRASPVLTALTGLLTLYHGSFDRPEEVPAPNPTVYTGSADAARFKFPYTKGHYRAQDAGDLSATAIFDVRDSGKIPTADPDGCGSHYSASCRTIFTNTVGGRLPDPVYFETGSAGALDGFFDDAVSVAGGVDLNTTDIEILITKILSAKLGGVDRSTPAVIQRSRVAPAGASRPIMSYFGALDGALHAVCVEALSPCTYPGQELWAYVPRTQLPLLRSNLQRIDGSANVSDLYGDFDNDGNAEWRTILFFQTGGGDPATSTRAPLVVALDITVPGSPTILWDYRTPGIGLTLASGPVRVGPDLKPVVFAVTNNGTAADAGVSVVAINAATGEQIWFNSITYDGPREVGDASVPTSGIPGGATGVDFTGNGTLTHILVPTLYGDVWMFDASDGANVYGDDPLFHFASSFHPIGSPVSIYKDATTGKLHAVFGSGGYADPTETRWAPDDVDQYVISVSLETPVGITVTEDPLDDFGGNRAFMINLGAGNRVYSQVTVAGNDLFVVTDSEDVNLDTYGLGAASGQLTQYSLDDGAAKGSAVTIQSGAGGVDVTNAGQAVAASGTEITSHTPDEFAATGSVVELSFTSSMSRREVWLRLQ